MGIMLGNLSISDMEHRVGVVFPDQLKEFMSNNHQEKASNIERGKWHCFDLPFMLVCGDIETATKIYEMLQPLSSEMAEPFTDYGAAMNTEQVRADFEAFATPRGYDLDAVMLMSKPPKFSRYTNPATQHAFEAYQAGRSAVQSQDRETVSTIHGDSYAGIYVWYGESNCLQRLPESAARAVNYEMEVFNFVAAGAIEALMDRVLGEAIDHAHRKTVG